MEDNKTLTLDAESIKILQEIEERKNNGEEVDPLTQEALDSINFASKIVDAVMNGKHIDLVYLKNYTQNVSDRVVKLSGLDNSGPRKRGKRKRPSQVKSG